MGDKKILLRLNGTTLEILEKLVERGYYRTKSEALQAGILMLAESYGLINAANDYWEELQTAVKVSGKNLSHEEITQALKRIDQ
jgi:Arc/MetJ-type ribon-helix-helix transcriptional regulator